MIEELIYRVIDWLTARNDETFDEHGQYTPWNIFWCVLAFFFALALAHFLFGFPR